MTTDLLAFLRARLDWDEQMAPGVHVEICSSVVRTVRNGVVWRVGDCDCGVPARVLADVAAKRRIVDHAEEWAATLRATPTGWTDEGATAYRMAMDWTLKLLAAPFADHPDYDPAWAIQD